MLQTDNLPCVPMSHHIVHVSLALADLAYCDHDYAASCCAMPLDVTGV